MKSLQQYVYRGLATLSLASALAVGTSSCSLDRDPPLNELSTTDVYKNPANYPQLVAKLYGGLVLTGMGAADGFDPRDIGFGDGGATSFSRALWKMQELPTDHAVVAWGDPGLPDLNTATMTTTNVFVQAMYVRIFFEIGLCNEYLRQTTDAKLAEYGITGADAERARAYRNDARFLRALSYYYAIDMFGNVPFVTENDEVTYFQPRQLSTDFATGRKALFDYVEGELKAIEGATPATADYGRAGQGAVRTLLAHLYLNAETWTGVSRATDCVTYAKKVIDEGGFALANDGDATTNDYLQMFGADNGQVARLRQEIILPITCDGQRTQSYGGSTFLIHASLGASFRDAEKGVSSGWAGIRAKPQLPLLWGDSVAIASGSITDQRCAFFTTGQAFTMRNSAALATFTKGLAVRKWTNKTSAGANGSNVTFTDTDIPLMRLGEVYLTYAEGVLRGGGGDRATALGYINDLRTRANAAPIADSDMTLDFLLDERGRETYWECYRRTDLIRFGKYTGGAYNWSFKGGSVAGTAIPDHFKVFPIPASDMAVNTNLVQNPGY